MSSYEDFVHPIKNKPEINARELRGITYIFREDGSLYKRYLMLNKFWNIGQVPETQYDQLKDLKIKNIYEKEDGSLITFLQLENGSVIPKTKGGFNNEQCEEAKKLYDADENIQKFLTYCFDNDLAVMFEYVSFKNKIVLDYSESKLILLRIRNNSTGEYLNVEDFRDYDIEIVKKEDEHTLDELIELSKTEKDREGWVISFENDYMVKQKTAFYFQRHRLLTESLNRENDIIEMILNETIDDIVSQLDPTKDKEKIEWINEITKIVNNVVTERMKEVEDLLTKYNNDIRDFAIRYNKSKNFGLAISVIKGKDIYEVVKDFILKNTKHLEDARNFVKNKGFKNK
jgi:T4 RnlA family RNA ligase